MNLKYMKYIMKLKENVKPNFLKKGGSDFFF